MFAESGATRRKSYKGERMQQEQQTKFKGTKIKPS